ncbi:MAG: GNAT family N-acetyltransferase [Bacteroidales bacterium]|nr:GNAT family N-acetyltransferase [Bacteroidales bacterium]
MNINKNTLYLRKFENSDAEIILSWCKDKHAFRLWSADRYKNFPALPNDMINMYNSEKILPLTLVDENNIVGHLILRYPTENKEIVRLGFVIVDNNKRGKGYGKKMLNLAIDYAQKNLGAKKLTLGVFCENISALECYKSVGFKILGEDCYSIDGENWNGYEMEIDF